MVSYEIRFVSKEPKLVLTLTETKRLVTVVSQNSETASLGVSVEPKLTASDEKQSNSIPPSVPPLFSFFTRFISLCYALICPFCPVDLYFGLFRFVSVQDPKQKFYSFTKQAETAWCFGWFRFEPKQTKCFAGHPLNVYGR